MNQDELYKRNKVLERRWKIAVAILILFIATRPIALYIVNKFIHKAAQDASTNDYPLIDPARKFIPQEDYIINIQALRNYLSDLGKKYPDTISIYYEQLNSGANIAINKSDRFFPESLNKIPMAVLAVNRVEDGEWNWSTEFSATPADLDSGSGNLYKTIGNNQISLEKLLEAMIIDSDNTAFNILARNMRPQDYSDYEDEVGLEDVYDSKGKVSAKDFSRIIRTLYTASYLNRENSDKILDLMSQSTFHDFLSQGVPSDVTFSHKFGENDKDFVYADAGIVYVPGKPYMIVVIVKENDNSSQTLQQVKDLMQQISQKAYDQDTGKLSWK